MFCTNCGKSIENDSAFCPECGTKVDIGNAPSLEKPVLSGNESEKTVYIPENQSESENVNADSGKIEEENELSVIPPPVENDFSNNSPFKQEQDQKNIPAKEEKAKTVSQHDIMHNGDKYDTISIPSIPTENPVNDQIFQNSNLQQQNAPYQQPAQQFQFGQPEAVPQPDYDRGFDMPQKSSKISGGRIAGASAVAVFSVVFLIVLSLLISLKFGVSPQMLKNNIENLSATTLLGAEYDGDEISDNIYKTIGFKSITHGNATEADFKDYLTKSNMLSFIGENVENYADYILNGNGSDPSITAEDIKNDFFKENNDVAGDIFGYTLAKDDLKLIQSRLEDENIDETLSVKEWNKKAGLDLRNVSYILSYITLGILLALVIVLFIWIAIIVDKKGRHIMSFYGNIVLISGIIMLVIGLGTFVGSAVAYSITGNVVFYLIQNILLFFGIFAVSIGAFETILGIIFKCVARGKKKKEKAAAQLQQQPVPLYN